MKYSQLTLFNKKWQFVHDHKNLLFFETMHNIKSLNTVHCSFSHSLFTVMLILYDMLAVNIKRNSVKTYSEKNHLHITLMKIIFFIEKSQQLLYLFHTQRNRSRIQCRSEISLYLHWSTSLHQLSSVNSISIKKDFQQSDSYNV